MKRWISILLALLVLAALLPASVLAAGGPVLQYALTSEGETTVGSVLTVTFSVVRTDSGEGYRVNAMQDEIEYDGDYFELVEGSIRLIRGGSAVTRADVRTDGTRIIAINDMLADYSAREDFCTFQLRVKKTGGTVRHSNAMAFSNDAADPRANLVADASGTIQTGGGSGSDSGNGITVTMRLIGAELAEKDVDLGIGRYLPSYVTWIPTTRYTLEKNATVYDLFVKAMEDAGLRSVGAAKNYVETIYAPDSLGGYALSEFTNGRRSGWMYTINGKHPGFGLKEQGLSDGDVVVWHYVNDYSYEVADWFSADDRWPSLGDGTYYNRWLLAPDYLGGKGGGLSESDSGNGTTTSAVESVIVVPGEVENGEVSVEVETKAVQEVLETVKDLDVITVQVETEESAAAVELTISQEAVEAVADSEASLKVETENGAIILSGEELKKLADGGDVTLRVEDHGDGSFTLDVTVNGESADVNLKTVLPASDDGKVLVRIYEDGSEEIVRKSLVEDKQVYSLLPAGTTVKLEDNSKQFEDVQGNEWFAHAVDVVSSHELFIGVSETEFAPKLPMTRAMLVTVLYRLENEPGVSGKALFSDVPADTWYTEAVEWAANNGIVNGVGNDQYAPNDNVTREQIVTMLFRYARYIGLDVNGLGSFDGFRDDDQISSWAKSAMAWAVKVGLFQGDDQGYLNPKADATRAEVSTLMERLISMIVK